MNWNSLAILFLICEGLGALIWWSILLSIPDSRVWFKAPNAPDSTLLGFAGADLVFFIGGSLGAAFGLLRGRSWAWPVLCFHAAASSYAALYCLGVSILSGGGWLATVFMAPSLIVVPILVWKLRPDLYR